MEPVKQRILPLRRLAAFLVAVLAAFAGLAAAYARWTTAAIAVPNGDFARGLDGWTVATADGGISTLAPDPAAPHAHKVLKIADDTESNGSDVSSPRIPLTGLHVLTLRGRACAVSGSGLGIYVRMYDRNGRMIGDPAEHQRSAPVAPVGQWQPFTLSVSTPPETASVDIWIHSYKAAKVTAYLSDFVLEDRLGDVSQPPWTPEYKIHPNETSRLTDADVVGPDGIVYPDWRGAGIPGGIPKSVKVAARAADFGAKPDDDRDDSDALERGMAAVGAKGGGALLLAPGVYNLDRPVVCERNGVVLRGAGAGKTIIRFRYGGAAPGQVQFYRPLPHAVVDPSTWIEIHADPTDLRQLALEVDGRQVATTTYYPQHWGGTFSLRPSAAGIVSKLADGPHTFRAVAVYADGRRVTHDLPVTTSRKETGQRPRIPLEIAGIMFNGPSDYGPRRLLARDGKRGDRTVTLQSAAGIHTGDCVVLEAPATERWNTLVNNACKWGTYRRYEFRVKGVDGETLTLNQPLRLDFPTIDGSYVSRVERIERCGVEDLTLEQTKELWTSGIVFSHAWECWARGVDVKKAGRFPLYFLQAKWCQIDDCSMEDVWYHGGGGTGYVGWETCCDCLMQNVHTTDMRHAPLVQWGASGNVIRDSVFVNSDAQWHSGWTNENLFENCRIVSAHGDRNGGYGYGMWASAPEDDAHGPNGPRNVVYNCDDQSQNSAVWMGGMNEAWIFVGNRYIVGSMPSSGSGIVAKETSFDHVFQNNVFVLRDSRDTLLLTGTLDCTGIELRGNTIYGGSGVLAAGAAKPLVAEGNRQMPAVSGDTLPPRPALEVPSIFAWERANGGKIRAARVEPGPPSSTP